MIQAVIFDLDGTLVKTEQLKAISYAKAAAQLCPRDVSEAEVVEAFKDVVGLSRREVAAGLMKRFELEQAARDRMNEFGVKSPWQSFVQIRLRIYNEMLSDPQTIRDNRWEHALELLDEVNAQACQTGLATMSYCEQASRVLKILELEDAFNVVATRDDVENSKPDPEIYQLVLAELGVSAAQALVIEDSPAGVEAALNAGTDVVAVATPFTEARLRELERLPKNRLVDDPAELLGIVKGVFREHAQG